MIETERLTLRVSTAEDLTAVAAIWADPEVVKYLAGTPFTREQSWQRLQRYVGHWTLFGYGCFAVVERATGIYVGEVGIANFEREIDPPIGPFEAGWTLSPQLQDRGYATEAMRAALAFHDAKFPGARVSCLVDVNNAASLRVAEKVGFVERLRTTYRGVPNVLLDRHS